MLNFSAQLFGCMALLLRSTRYILCQHASIVQQTVELIQVDLCPKPLQMALERARDDLTNAIFTGAFLKPAAN